MARVVRDDACSSDSEADPDTETAAKEESHAGKLNRRPAGFWAVFNDWSRNFVDTRGRRPTTLEVEGWFAENAVKVWPDERTRPSLQDTRVHGKSLRSTEAVKQYFRLYRSRSKGGQPNAKGGAAATAAAQAAVRKPSLPVPGMGPHPSLTIPRLHDDIRQQGRMPTHRHMSADLSEQLDHGPGRLTNSFTAGETTVAGLALRSNSLATRSGMSSSSTAMPVEPARLLPLPTFPRPLATGFAAAPHPQQATTPTTATSPDPSNLMDFSVCPHVVTTFAGGQPAMHTFPSPTPGPSTPSSSLPWADGLSPQGHGQPAPGHNLVGAPSWSRLLSQLTVQETATAQQPLKQQPGGQHNEQQQFLGGSASLPGAMGVSVPPSPPPPPTTIQAAQGALRVVSSDTVARSANILSGGGQGGSAAGDTARQLRTGSAPLVHHNPHELNDFHLSSPGRLATPGSPGGVTIRHHSPGGMTTRHHSMQHAYLKRHQHGHQNSSNQWMPVIPASSVEGLFPNTDAAVLAGQVGDMLNSSFTDSSNAGGSGNGWRHPGFADDALPVHNSNVRPPHASSSPLLTHNSGQLQQMPSFGAPDALAMVSWSPGGVNKAAREVAVPPESVWQMAPQALAASWGALPGTARGKSWSAIQPSSPSLSAGGMRAGTASPRPGPTEPLLPQHLNVSTSLGHVASAMAPGSPAHSGGGIDTSNNNCAWPPLAAAAWFGRGVSGDMSAGVGQDSAAAWGCGGAGGGAITDNRTLQRMHHSANSHHPHHPSSLAHASFPAPGNDPTETDGGQRSSASASSVPPGSLASNHPDHPNNQPTSVLPGAGQSWQAPPGSPVEALDATMDMVGLEGVTGRVAMAGHGWGGEEGLSSASSASQWRGSRSMSMLPGVRAGTLADGTAPGSGGVHVLRPYGGSDAAKLQWDRVGSGSGGMLGSVGGVGGKRKLDAIQSLMATGGHPPTGVSATGANRLSGSCSPIIPNAQQQLLSDQTPAHQVAHKPGDAAHVSSSPSPPPAGGNGGGDASGSVGDVAAWFADLADADEGELAGQPRQRSATGTTCLGQARAVQAFGNMLAGSITTATTATTAPVLEENEPGKYAHVGHNSTESVRAPDQLSISSVSPDELM